VREFIEQHGRYWRYNIDAKRWLHYQPANGIWEPDDSLIQPIMEMAFVVSQQILRTVAGPH
jgi:hypothetical protein